MQLATSPRAHAAGVSFYALPSAPCQALPLDMVTIGPHDAAEAAEETRTGSTARPGHLGIPVSLRLHLTHAWSLPLTPPGSSDVHRGVGGDIAPAALEAVVAWWQRWGCVRRVGAREGDGARKRWPLPYGSCGRGGSGTCHRWQRVKWWGSTGTSPRNGTGNEN